MKKVLYKTDMLDLAAYIMTCGYEYEYIKRKGLHDTVFAFQEGDKPIARVVEEFLMGRANVNLSHYLFIRSKLKEQSRKQPFKTDIEVSLKPQPLHLIPGQQYWFINQGASFSNMFADKEPHLERLRSGNVYASKEQAEAYLRRIKEE